MKRLLALLTMLQISTATTLLSAESDDIAGAAKPAMVGSAAGAAGLDTEPQEYDDVSIIEINLRREMAQEASAIFDFITEHLEYGILQDSWAMFLRPDKKIHNLNEFTEHLRLVATLCDSMRNMLLNNHIELTSIYYLLYVFRKVAKAKDDEFADIKPEWNVGLFMQSMLEKTQHLNSKIQAKLESNTQLEFKMNNFSELLYQKLQTLLTASDKRLTTRRNF